jgi:selenium binding protein SBP56
MALYVGTDVGEPDYMATVGVDLKTSTYSQVVHRTTIPNVGDELHHLGWNACNSCHGDESKSHRFLLVPGQRSSRIHIIDTADERAPKIDCHTEQGGMGQRRLLRGLWGRARWPGSGERHTPPRGRRHLGHLDLRPTTHSKENR